MDYETKPVSRKDLRRFSAYLRELLDVPLTGPFPVLLALDKVSDVFKGSKYEIVDDRKLPPQTMARCMPNDQGGFTIEIKESVYNGAYEKGTGAHRGFICHEICHVYLFTLGFTPIFERGFANNVLPPYRSVEWQAKALCAEVMIPYEESKGMTAEKIERKYGVSKAFARKRKELERK